MPDIIPVLTIMPGSIPIFIFVLQTGKLRHRGVSHLTYTHPGSKWQSQVLNQDKDKFWLQNRALNFLNSIMVKIIKINHVQ